MTKLTLTNGATVEGTDEQVNHVLSNYLKGVLRAASVEKNQSKTATTVKRRRSHPRWRLWTHDDDERLVKLRREGVKGKEIARILNRPSHTAISARLKILKEQGNSWRDAKTFNPEKERVKGQV